MTSHETPPSPLKPDVALIDIQCADLIGHRLLNIYGYQQQSVVDLMDDESSWWLEFEYGIWVTVKSIIAPAFVDTTFQLQFRFFHAVQFPLRNSAPFTKNPPQLAPLLGLQLLEQMESVFDDAHLSIEALRLGFGNDNNITAELHIGYLDAVTGESWPGMGAKAIRLETARKAEPPQGHSVDRLVRYAQAISNAKQEKKSYRASADRTGNKEGQRPLRSRLPSAG